MEPQEGQEEAAERGDAGGLPALVNQIGQGLTDLAQGLQQAGAPDQLVQGAAQILQMFTQYAQALMSAAQGGAQAGGPGGPQSMEGGAEGVPAGDMRMRG